MASPPFVLNVTIPGDTDIVSQFPGVDRTHLDILNSWLKTDHNVNGTHNYSTYLQVGVADGGGNTAAAPSPASNNSALFRDTDGALKMKRGEDSTVEFMGGVPPGVILPYGGSSLPTGYLWADGSNVSRTTYARLFTAYGTLYGAGDGSTTFGLPDLNNRVPVGRDRTGTGRITTAISGFDGATLGAAGGLQSHQLIVAELPTFTPTVASYNLKYSQSAYTNVAVNDTAIITVNRGEGNANAPVTGTITMNSVGGDTPHRNVQPSLIVNYIIRI